MLNANEIIAKHFEGDPANAVRAHAAVQEIFRAKADAQPYGWAAPHGNYFTRSEAIAKRIGGLIPVYTHPEASAPGLSDENSVDDILASIPEVSVAESAIPRECGEYVEAAFRAIAHQVLTRASAATVAEPTVACHRRTTHQCMCPEHDCEVINPPAAQQQAESGADPTCLVSRLRVHADDKRNSAFSRSAMREAADVLAGLLKAEPGADERAVCWYDPDDFTRTTAAPTAKEWKPLYDRPAAQSGQRAGVAEVAVGEEWYARLPHASALIHCWVRDVTAETVLLRENDYTNGVRYLRSDVTFIERIAAAHTPQQEGGK